MIDFGNCVLVNSWQNWKNESIAKKIVCKIRICVYDFGWHKTLVSYRTDGIGGHSHRFHNQKSPTEDIRYTLLDIYSRSHYKLTAVLLVLLKLVTPPTLVTGQKQSEKHHWKCWAYLLQYVTYWCHMASLSQIQYYSYTGYYPICLKGTHLRWPHWEDVSPHGYSDWFLDRENLLYTLQRYSRGSAHG